MKKYITKIYTVITSRTFGHSVQTLGVFLMVATVFGVGTVHPVVFAKEEIVASVSDVRTEDEVLWLARTVYSETKISEEQLLVAWVIRNRVESKQYPDTYKEVVLQRGQFSGLHPSDKQYGINMSLTLGHTGPGWDSSIEIARAVYDARGILRPFPKTVRHFYSPQSVTVHPSWATDEKPVRVIRSENKENIRFAFYDSI
jgi:spore germination cell wall hydrolase CwlJ-like protein